MKIFWRFKDLVPEVENAKAIKKNIKMVYIVQLYTYNKACNIEKDIYYDFLKGQPFLLRDPIDVETRLNFWDVTKTKKNLMNQILIKTVLLDFECLLIEACFALEFLRGIYNTFIGNSLFIYLI